MTIDRISFSYNTSPNITGKAGNLPPEVKGDTFVKSVSANPASGSDPTINGIYAKEASNILFSIKNAKDNIDPFGLKVNNLSAQSATVDPQTGTYFMGLVDKADGQKRYIAAFEPDGSSKWKVPFEADIFGMVPDNKGGVIVRLYSKIFNFDGDGNQNWKFNLPNTGEEYHEPPVFGPDNSLFYCTEKEGSVEMKNNLSIVALKDGELQWVSEHGNGNNKCVDITVTKKGNLLFTAEEERKPDSLMRRMRGKSDKKRFLICLNPDGSKKFEKEVIKTDYRSVCATEGPDGTIYHLSDGGESLNAITPDGEEKWKCPTDRISWAPVIDEKGNIYVATGSECLGVVPESSIVCIDSKDGSKKWEHKIDRAATAPPLFKGDFIYLKVSKQYKDGSVDGYMKVNRDGSSVEFLNETANDGDALKYLSDGTLITRTGGYYNNNYQAVQMTSLGSISPDMKSEMVQDKSGTIEVKDKSVVIGGVELKRGKHLGLFGHWL